MCGIAGYVLRSPSERDLNLVLRSLGSMGHRGPDDEGLIVFSADGTHQGFVTDGSNRAVDLPHFHGWTHPHSVAFGHRRFSIVDLSASGHQPMWDSHGDVCVSVNGEIYNYVELRQELIEHGHHFNTGSDSEVMAVGFREWGSACFEKFNGFWAASIFDRRSGRVTLSRDRLGKAPLYVTDTPEGVFWASEIGALRELAGSNAPFTVREQSVVDFVTWQRRDFDNSTFFTEVETFPSGSWSCLNPRSLTLNPQQFWSVVSERQTSADIGEPEAVMGFRELLTDSVRLRLRSDVPAAVQLSGGLDSSSITALASQLAPSVDAFTVKFAGQDVDEEPFARAVAERYATTVDYHVFEPPDDDFINNANDFVRLMGEPFHSPNLFTANRIWHEIASQGYRVNLYGSGGDELLAGYSTQYAYPFVRHLLRKGRPGAAVRELLSITDRELGRFGQDIPLRLLRTLPGAQKYVQRLRAPARQADDPLRITEGLRPRGAASERLEQRMIDLLGDQLLNYWLRIDSQNSMSVPLELRNPFLDYRVVDFVFSLPLDYLIRDGWMKWLLRSAMEDALPHDITWRRQKSGFPFPLADWLIRHEQPLQAMLAPLDSSLVCGDRLTREWTALVNRDPQRLWALVSTGLWWIRVVQNEELTC